MKTFKDKVAVITGAGSGMGRYLAILLAKDGADVCVCDVNKETLGETVAMLRKYNVSVSSHLLDVSDKDAIEALPQKVIDQHGKVDLVFNNAGVTAGAHFNSRSSLMKKHRIPSLYMYKPTPAVTMALMKNPANMMTMAVSSLPILV